MRHLFLQKKSQIKVKYVPLSKKNKLISFPKRKPKAFSIFYEVTCNGKS